MPRKETLKERLVEESIWIMLIIFFGFALIWSVVRFTAELKYMLNGVEVQATMGEDEGIATFIDKKGDTYIVILDDAMAVVKDNKLPVIYMENNPEDHIVPSDWRWWVAAILMPLGIVIWSISTLYQNFRKRKIIKQKYTYDKKEVTSEELGKIILEYWSAHSKDLYEKHLDSKEHETIMYKKIYEADKATAERIIVEQEKIWKVGTFYLGVFLEENIADGVARIAYTDNGAYLKDPMKFYEIVKRGELEQYSDIYVNYTIVEWDKLPFWQQKNRFYFVIAKPGLTNYAIMVPEWHYMKEEIECM